MFQRENGHCDVSALEGTLGLWVRKTRQFPHFLSDTQRKQLDSLGFTWTDIEKVRSDRQWDQQLEKLMAYKAEYGHTRVPQRWEQDKVLGRWVMTQRKYYHQ